MAKYNYSSSEITAIGICGIGFVGNAVLQTFTRFNLNSNFDPLILKPYDLYKKIGEFDDLLTSDLIFICLPTPLNSETNSYDTSSIDTTLEYLHEARYNGIIAIKSTTQPGFCQDRSTIYPALNIIHNPEFLSARTAVQDFGDQKHIILGTTRTCSDAKILQFYKFYQKYFPAAKISISSSTESETTKLFCNAFYATKIQFFTELYDFAGKMNVDYHTIRHMMLENGWINPMHTQIPGHDGQTSYGGACFPKDTNALLTSMKEINSHHKVLEAVIQERNDIRKD